MRRKALLSIMTLYHEDQTIFDRLQLPAGPSPNEKVDYNNLFRPQREVLIAGILTDLAELEIIFPDPDTIKDAIYYWSVRKLPTWQKLLDSCLFDYNPIWNVDGDIDITRSGTESGQHSTNYNKSGDRDLNRNLEGSETMQVSAYDSSTWQNSNRTQRDESVTESEPWSESGSDAGSTSGSSSGTEHTRRTGNIGVTMTQDMILKERDVAMFDWYNYIINDFKRQFCIMVY